MAMFIALPRVARYCDERVCLSVCLSVRSYVSSDMSKLHEIFCGRGGKPMTLFCVVFLTYLLHCGLWRERGTSELFYNWFSPNSLSLLISIDYWTIYQLYP